MARETARRVLQIEAQAVSELCDRIDESFDRAVELVIGCTGRVVLTGMGKSGIVCQKISATFSSTGTPAYFMHPAEALHGDLGMLVAGDVLVSVSNSGETAEIVRLLEIVRRIGARIVALTGNPDSTLARNADVHLDVSVAREACSLDLAPTASTTASLAMGDALAVAVYEQRGFSPQDFARVHPGGRLGRKLLRVRELMHHGDDLPAVSAAETVERAIAEMSRSKLGMTCVVDASGVLLGILTDGDLRRLLLRETDPLRAVVESVMTRSPVTLGGDALASEALLLMEDRKITSVPVVDDKLELQGVVQIHDLWRTELF
ncbi:MAG: KpsF/GutQ family sugar-phosphate isomerase [bacterium]|nr:KpsF/GutQ family sugar-phosphate isomerase [bacterium]